MTNNGFYVNNSSRIDTVAGDNEYWELLIRIRSEFVSVRNKADQSYMVDEFQQYLIDNYGIRMALTSGGMITRDYEVIDEQKYMIAVLKFK